MVLPLFCVAKRNKEKKESFKAEAIRRLPPKSKCYCFSHSRASRIQKFFWSANHGGRQYLSVFHGPSTFKSISPALCFKLAVFFEMVKLKQKNLIQSSALLQIQKTQKIKSSKEEKQLIIILFNNLLLFCLKALKVKEC